MSSDKLLPWAKPLLISSTLTQATIYVLRPMITYRALELDANAAQIGLIASVYALFPVLLALQFGKWVGRMGEAKFIIYGTLAMLVTSAGLMVANSILWLSIAAACAGTAHLACNPWLHFVHRARAMTDTLVSIHSVHQLVTCLVQ
jgi:MFS family permease